MKKITSKNVSIICLIVAAISVFWGAYLIPFHGMEQSKGQFVFALIIGVFGFVIGRDKFSFNKTQYYLIILFLSIGLIVSLLHLIYQRSPVNLYVVVIEAGLLFYFVRYFSLKKRNG